MEQFIEYKLTILIIGLSALLILIQAIIADIVSIKVKHPPGFPVPPDHTSFLFRAVRSHANSNEVITVYILLVLFGIFSSANPHWLNNLSIIFIAGRVLHMMFYYAEMGLLRSIAFSISALALVGMFVIGIVKWF